MDVKVIKCRFRFKRAQTYTRIQLFPSTFKKISALNDFNVYAYSSGQPTSFGRADYRGSRRRALMTTMMPRWNYRGDCRSARP